VGEGREVVAPLTIFIPKWAITKWQSFFFFS